MTALYSVWHLLVDGLCAIAMFGRFIPSEGGYFDILVYNFCAFALQMPFGVLLDGLNARGKKPKRDFNFLIAAIGVICTVIGVYTNPVILGIGNALFHIGGGVGTIHDSAGNRLIVRLGIFVAPGAIGLYLGTMLADAGVMEGGILRVSAGMLLIGGAASWFLMQRVRRQNIGEKHFAAMLSTDEKHNAAISNTYAKDAVVDLAVCTNSAVAETGYGIAAVCLIVVILRSYIGMAVGFSWKTGMQAGLFAVLAIACGKTAGGLLAAKFGTYRTAAVSLILAAVCYLFSFVMPVGLAALFLFNMTMPITLYWIIGAFPRLPGFAFGILTFALFLGFLPKYIGMEIPIGGNIIGCVGSLFALLLISVGLWKRRTRL